ncbi:flagellar associated protein 107 [Haematococcus lacustris]|uniref:Flagellar associated protein 107 n=1 Tax=Haematococcus lacustris TaxID=44745 RepID=A0A6A0AE00_HAELA|nr:flagellar associated protein 107 [Haematococcus lacustris]
MPLNHLTARRVLRFQAVGKGRGSKPPAAAFAAPSNATGGAMVEELRLRQHRAQPGVLISNFVEDLAGESLKATGKHHLGLSGPFIGNSTQRRAYTAEGKTGEALAAASHRRDLDTTLEGPGMDILTRHGEFAEPRQTFHATMNQLTFAAERVHGEPRVRDHMWTGKNVHNASVTLNTPTVSLTTTKLQQWQEEGLRDAYSTSSRSAQLSAALPSAEHPPKAETMRRTTEAGELMSVGRKPLGPHSDTCDLTYRKTGLRGVYYRGNQA